jgi:hypothetical protein
MPVYRIRGKIKKLRQRRSSLVSEEPVSEVYDYQSPVSINFYYGLPAENYNPVQHPSSVPEQSTPRRGMSNSRAFGWIAGSIIGLSMIIGVGIAAENPSHENSMTMQPEGVQIVVEQVAANPVESYMRYWNFTEPAISALKPLGCKGYWDTNDKALADRLYYLPDYLKNDGTLLSYAEAITRDWKVDDKELSEFIKLEYSLRQQPSQTTQLCSSCVQHETQPSYPEQNYTQQYPQEYYPYQSQQQYYPQYQQPTYPQYNQPSQPSQSYPSGPSPRPDSGTSSSGGPAPRPP